VSPEAFRRFALVAAGSGLVAALSALSVFVAWWAGPVSLVVGVGLAFVVTLEQTPPPVVAQPREPEGLSSREIARRAERAGNQ